MKRNGQKRKWRGPGGVWVLRGCSCVARNKKRMRGCGSSGTEGKCTGRGRGTPLSRAKGLGHSCGQVRKGRRVGMDGARGKRGG